MTSKRQRGAGYLLPDQIDGHETIMACICVPDTLEYRAALRGALYELTKYWNWEERYVEGENPPVAAAHYWLELLAEGFKMPCNVCDLIAECLDNAEPGTALYDSLIDWFERNGGSITPGGDGTNDTLTPGAQDNLITLATCDPDLVFGFALQLTELMHELIIDLFEIIEVTTNFIELLADIVEIVPILAPFADYIQWLRDVGRENYLANYDVALKNKIACDIFCKIMESSECTITWWTLLRYFATQTYYALADVKISDYITYVLAGVWDGDEYVYQMFMLLSLVLAVGADWTGVNLAAIQRIITSFWNDPNSDWETLCGSCGWTLDQALDSAHTEAYWEATCGIVDPTIVRSTVCTDYRGLSINVTLPEVREVSRIKAYYRYDGLGETGKGRYTLFDDDDNVLQGGDWALDVMNGGFDTYTKDVNQVSVKRVKIELIASFDETEGGYTATNQIEISGSGSDPFV